MNFLHCRRIVCAVVGAALMMVMAVASFADFYEEKDHFPSASSMTHQCGLSWLTFSDPF